MEGMNSLGDARLPWNNEATIVCHSFLPDLLYAIVCPYNTLLTGSLFDQ